MLQDPCTIRVFHPLEQDEHLTVWGLWEQVHSHSLDWSEGSALHSVGWGSAETVVRKQCQGEPHRTSQGLQWEASGYWALVHPKSFPQNLLHKVAHGCPGVARNIQELLEVLSSTDSQDHLGI